MEAEAAVREIAAFMKQSGYKKRGNGFLKRTDDAAIAVSVQKSQWGGGVWYLCFGVTALSILDLNSFSAPNYPVRERLDGKTLTVEQIEYAVSLWEKKYGSFEKLLSAAVEDRLPVWRDGAFVGKLCSQAWRLFN